MNKHKGMIMRRIWVTEQENQLLDKFKKENLLLSIVNDFFIRIIIRGDLE